jgi:hypothetical protein
MSEASVETPFDPVQSRQDEVAQYDQSIAMYQSVASGLPSEWPAHLVQFKGRTDTHAAIAEIEDLDDVQVVCDLWAHDQAQAAIRSNMVERAKAQAILNAMLAAQ